MAIRLRRVDDRLLALCAARSVPKDGDVYLDDEAHHALTQKFSRDFREMGFYSVPVEPDPIVDREESNNPNREWWDRTYRDEVPR